jgi:hypothetical protein
MDGTNKRIGQVLRRARAYGHWQRRWRLALVAVTLLQLGFFTSADALVRQSAPSRHSSHEVSVRGHGRHTHNQLRTNTQSSRSSRQLAHGRKGRHHHLVAKRAEKHHVAVVHSAYPLDFFLVKAPAFDTSPLPPELAATVRSSFARGTADGYSPRTLVKAGVVSYHPIRGGIFWRREPIKYVIMHSTEPTVVQSAERVIESWSSMGRRHPGAQYVVDRDGTILQALDPDLASVHVNVFKTLPGINNDDSVGIEMCHTGKQDYPQAQIDSVIKLVTYLQNRYHVLDSNVVTHKYAQQGDHTDPVNFDWQQFLASKGYFMRQALAFKFHDLTREALTWLPAELTPTPETFLQIHRRLESSKEDKNPVEFKIPPEEKFLITPPTSRPVEVRQPVNLPKIEPSNKLGMPALRGPIEMSPAEASVLNRAIEAPLPGQNVTLPPMQK